MKRVFFTAAAAAVATAISLPSAFAGDAAPGAAGVPARAPHYEWQYHYVGHHPRFEGHWVLVR